MRTHAVGQMMASRVHLLFRYAGADQVDAIEHGLGGDLRREPMELKVSLFDRGRNLRC
jgi:hypothetical protein